jgi:DNA-binding GntR family transcriptional regulator
MLSFFAFILHIAPGRLNTTRTPIMEHQDKSLPISPIPRQTVQDHVYEQLKMLILNGEIEPGSTVTIQSLSDAFGVSPMPVRESLRRLVAEKALRVVAGRSVGVPPLTIERLEDLKRVRIEIEGAATEWAAQSITRTELKRLSELIELMDLAEIERNRKKYVPANHEFHFIIYRCAGSEILLSVIESLWLQIGPYFGLLNASKDWRTSNTEHRAIKRALSERNGAAARRALGADIEGAAAALKRILVDQYQSRQHENAGNYSMRPQSGKRRSLDLRYKR